MSPTTLSNEAPANAIANESTDPTPALRIAPQQAAEIYLHPRQNSKKARPISAIKRRDSSTSTSPRTAGPITMPATISMTTEGTR
jgi:hypothetical protein